MFVKMSARKLFLYEAFDCVIAMEVMGNQAQPMLERNCNRSLDIYPQLSAMLEPWFASLGYDGV